MHVEKVRPHPNDVLADGHRPPSSRMNSQVCCDIAKLALLQLRLPEDRIRVLSDLSVYSGLASRVGQYYSEAVLNPTVLLDMIQVDEATGESISMRSREDASRAKL